MVAVISATDRGYLIPGAMVVIEDRRFLQQEEEAAHPLPPAVSARIYFASAFSGSLSASNVLNSTFCSSPFTSLTSRM